MKHVEVHIDWRGTPSLVGRLYPAGKGNSVTFEYDRIWLERPEAFPIDPVMLPLQRSAHHGAVLFSALQDCGPDRWGRVLIDRAARKKLLEQKPYRDIDYVLALDDFSRIGALRFRAEGSGPFLAASEKRLPPVVRLNALIRATDAIHYETETAEDLRFLLGEGSPLGGARPKSAVLLADGQLGIAKFPKPDDTRDIAAGEILALELSQAAGITAAGHSLVKVGARSVAVISRFDRVGTQRLPFISGATLLGLAPGEPGSYTQLADGIRRFGHDVPGDLRELWRRMVFSLLISNFDDHLRNHGFLMREPGHWSLSPAYDLNPVPQIDRVQDAQTAISETSEEPSLEEAFKVAARFGLKPDEAKAILREVLKAVANWRTIGRRLRFKATTLSAYESVFENPRVAEAKILRF
jgi:serine/threonine-protein kinase HipA